MTDKEKKTKKAPVKAEKKAAPAKKEAAKAEAKKSEKKAAKPAKEKKALTVGDAANAKLYDIIVRPVITEKSTAALQHNKVLFRVHPGASKPEIKTAVEKLFDVTVTGVNTVSIRGKVKRFKGTIGQRSDYKKAIVTLKEGDSIDFAVGVK